MRDPVPAMNTNIYVIIILKCEIHAFSLQKSVKMNNIMCLFINTQMKMDFQNLKINFHVLQLTIKFFFE